MAEQDPFDPERLPPLPKLGDRSRDASGPVEVASEARQDAASDREAAPFPEPLALPEEELIASEDDEPPATSLSQSRPNIKPDLIGGQSEARRSAVEAMSLAELDDRDDDESSGAGEISSMPPIDLPGQTPSAAHTASSSKPDPFIGTDFVGYRILEPLGQGGMGMVYKANQVRLDRKVAIKMLNKALVDNEEFIRRFQREARSMAQLHHPNIVSVIDFGEKDSIWYMVVEFVDGTNVAKMIREQLMVPAKTLLPIVVQCLSGLDYVARSGVVHRDIKPDNILIDKDQVAKLADFGLAKDFSKEEETDLTAAGSAMGTPSYMSPEQCMGRPLDVRSDLYALGVTAYYALTGEKPFVGQSSFEIMMKQREHQPPAPNSINPQIPAEIATLVMRMIEKNPSARFDTADACREAWLIAGSELGYLGATTRSGEYYFLDGKIDDPRPRTHPELGAIDGGDSLAARSGPALAYPEADLPRLAPVPDLKDLKGGAGDISSLDAEAVSVSRSPSSRHGAEGGAGTGTHSLPGQERSASRTHARSKDQRREGSVAKRLGSTKLAANTGPVRLGEADRLFRAGDFKAAAGMYARLAEQTDDRRQRTLLRTKEREARSRIENQEVADIQKRLARLTGKGSYQDAITYLERVRQDTSSSTMDRFLGEEVVRVRKQIVARARRRRLMVLACIGVVLAVLAVIFKAQLQEIIQILAGNPAPAEVSAPDAGGAQP